MKYGLDDACYDDLMKLRRMYPDELSDRPERKGDGRSKRYRRSKRDSLTTKQLDNVVVNADTFEEVHKLSVSNAATIAIRNGWPDSDEDRIMEMYRRNPRRKAHADAMFGRTAEIVPKDDTPIEKMKCLYDYECRQGKPTGPEVCHSYEEYLDVLVQIVNWIIAEHGEWFADESARMPPIHVVDGGNEHCITAAEMISHLKYFTGVDIPQNILELAIRDAAHRGLFPTQLATLRHIDVVVPLDCSKETRDKTIDAIVEHFKELRRTAGHKDGLRNSIPGLQEDLRGLGDRIKRLRRRLHPTQYRKVSSGIDDGKDRANLLLDAMKEVLPQYIPAYEANEDELEEMASDIIDTANDLAQAGRECAGIGRAGDTSETKIS